MNTPEIYWNNLPSLIDPIVFSVGFFSVRWYSLMILVTFLIIYLLVQWRIKHDKKTTSNLPTEKVESLFIYLAIGVIVGARLGYSFFYDLSATLQNPISIISPFESGSFVGIFGLSFHGGVLGTIAGGLLFCKKNNINFLKMANFLIPTIPLGYFFGRIGNFLNGELFGRPTDSPIGMFFPLDETSSLRHPSQLYEAIGEGLILFAILWPIRNNKRMQNFLLPLYLILYSTIRFLIEFYRMPDNHLGLIFWNLSMGQVLSSLMFFVGLILLIHTKKHRQRE
ncbi:MAG: prolipoprotein diacylglyceryl transferase [Patescibacteria group bacterium]|nr:prolipoprotein diacylglyceryl transferase [Patescibacteria group bacterium]